jgi:polynucleotide 5'-hydroxyl-kinase GRC3/NOL9
MTLDVPSDWAKLIGWLSIVPWQRLAVLGGTDMGKSSFCRLLCGQLAERGQSVALLDTDLGQKMIGPPACVSLARCTAHDTLELERVRFVGEASPAANMPGVIAATARLADLTSADRLVVNTSGLINGPGIPLKRWKLDALNSDHVLAIARGDELAPILAALPATRVRHLHPSPAARRKSPSVRERNRRASLLAALGECRPVSLPGLIVEDLLRSPPRPDALRVCGSLTRPARIARWD